MEGSVSNLTQTSDEVNEARTAARDVLIGYLMEPPTETEAALRKAVKRLATELDVSYEAAFRYLLAGHL